jgi:anti-sigma-K factor RskA
MSEEEDIRAAEFVLGTLPADERADFARRLEGDAALRAAVARWQARFHPLDDGDPVAPFATTWPAIHRLTAAGATREGGDMVFRLKRRLAAWRGAAVAAGALAAGLAAILVFDRAAVPEGAATGRYVAVVDAEGREPALIAEVDTVAGIIRVRSLHAETPEGRSLELWHVPEGQAPRSLGVLSAGLDAQTLRSAGGGLRGGIIAVSVEPQGGSPSGAPTGPIVYSGRLVPVEE